ncbi:MAG: PEP-CTERM sorting domain-containing protein [Phycisphaerales bacterium]|jgi:hypothetical protein|nr:PEP-CTERM sorting domain-containing protein [Phycisphaerales bacterium]
MNTFTKMMAMAGVALVGVAVSNVHAVVLGPNLITVNEDVEDGSLVGWIGGNAKVLSTDTLSGTGHSVESTQSDSTNHYIDAYLGDSLDHAGGNYYFEVDYKTTGSNYVLVTTYATGYQGWATLPGTNGAWTHYSSSGPFNLPSGTDPYIGFSGQSGGDVFYLDNLVVQKEVVPEPASMLLMGMSALGLMARRRRH